MLVYVGEFPIKSRIDNGQWRGNSVRASELPRERDRGKDRLMNAVQEGWKAESRLDREKVRKVEAVELHFLEKQNQNLAARVNQPAWPKQVAAK